MGWNVTFNQQALDEVRELANPTDDADIGKMHKPRAVSAINERVADDVAAIQERGALPLTLGGDHSLVSAAVYCEGIGEMRSARASAIPLTWSVKLEQRQSASASVAWSLELRAKERNWFPPL